MAKYFELLNDNQNVVVDDQFHTPKFLIKTDITTGSDLYTGNYKIDANTWKYQAKTTVIARGDTLRDLGFDYDDSDFLLVMSRLLVFAQSSSGEPFRVEPEIWRASDTGQMILGVDAVADVANTAITICLYTTAKMLPSRLGMLVYNENGEVVFDALKGYLQHVGILNGGVVVGQTVAATYQIDIPEGMLSEHLFISMRSALPYYAAYRIQSTVTYAYTYYYPVMTFPTLTSMQVQLIQQRSVNGSTNATRYNHYFENVIYCPYPKDIYTGYVG